MAHKIGETGEVEFNGKRIELEFSTREYDRSDSLSGRECPEGWQIPTYPLLQHVRNSPRRDEFHLLKTFEHVQNPDDISRKNGFVARFGANSDGAGLDCYGYPSYCIATLGVRYMREIPQAETS